MRNRSFMRSVIVILMVLCFANLVALPALAAQSDQPATTAQDTPTINVKPIPPEQVAAGAQNFGARFVKYVQSLAAPAVPMTLVGIGIVIMIGFLVSSVTKSVLKTGIGMAFGLAIMYILVFHYDTVLGIVKGFAGQK